jgi:surface protein
MADNYLTLPSPAHGYHCYFFNGNLSGWNVSEATDMEQMFLGCTHLVDMYRPLKIRQLFTPYPVERRIRRRLFHEIEETGYLPPGYRTYFPLGGAIFREGMDDSFGPTWF